MSLQDSPLCPQHSARQPVQPPCPACRYERRLVIHDHHVRALEERVERLEATLDALEPSRASAPRADP
ncbi:hypothetical protein [Halococcus sediminicola]|uniref:hypothetical protein n=1 Tax=Halococcus sediminicola TaxID=1264579 RepID=UPI000A602085|nr:hypothetical protein [Halococcus sediminicola]